MRQKDTGNRHCSWHEAVGRHHHRLRHLQPAITVCRHHPLSAINHRKLQHGSKSIIRHHRLRYNVSYAKSLQQSHRPRLHFISLSRKPSQQRSQFVSRRLHQRHYVNSCRKSCRRLSLLFSRHHRLLRVHRPPEEVVSSTNGFYSPPPASFQRLVHEAVAAEVATRHPSRPPASARQPSPPALRRWPQEEAVPPSAQVQRSPSPASLRRIIGEVVNSAIAAAQPPPASSTQVHHPSDGSTTESRHMPSTDTLREPSHVSSSAKKERASSSSHVSGSTAGESRRAAQRQQSSPSPPASPRRHRKEVSSTSAGARHSSPSPPPAHRRRSSSSPPAARRRTSPSSAEDRSRRSPSAGSRHSSSAPSSGSATGESRRSSSRTSSSSPPASHHHQSRREVPSSSGSRHASPPTRSRRSRSPQSGSRSGSHRSSSVDTPRPSTQRTPDSAGESRRSSTDHSASPHSGSEREDSERTLLAPASSSSSRRRRSTSTPAGERSRQTESRHREAHRSPSSPSEGSEDERTHTSRRRSRDSSSSTSNHHERDDSSDTPRRKPSIRRESSASRKQNTVRFAGSVADDQSSDSDDDVFLPVSQNRHSLKPPIYNGTENFETFYARFENCAKYNGWSREEQLAHLRNSLTNEAGQVLWDSGPEVTNSLRRLTTLLKSRFGGAVQSDKFKMELRSRIRQPRESLTSLYSDIKRLIALGYPDLDPKAREVIAVDRFIDSLDDADLALKIRERTPITLDEALRAGMQQEVWNKDTARLRPSEPPTTKAVRPVEEDVLKDVNQKLSQLQKQIEQSNRQRNNSAPRGANTTPQLVSPPPTTYYQPAPTVYYQPASPAFYPTPANTPVTPTAPPVPEAVKSPAPAMMTPPASGPVAAPSVASTPPSTPRAVTRAGTRRYVRTPGPPGSCFNCGSTDHRIAACPTRPPRDSQSTTPASPSAPPQPPQTRPVRECQNGKSNSKNVYLSARIKQRPINVLLDTGSDVSLAPYSFIEKYKSRLRKSETKSLKAANGSDVIIAGEATLPLYVADRLLHTVVLVSKDISEIILGSDWLTEHECDWHFASGRVRIGAGGEWISLTGKNQEACRRVYVDQDTIIEPNQLRMIPARATLNNIRRIPSIATIEPHELRKGIYVGRTLVPPQHDQARVCVMNTTPEPLHIVAGTTLGQLQPATLLGKISQEAVEAEPSIAKPSSEAVATGSTAEDSVIPKLVESFPEELNDQQREAATRLLYDYEDVFSKNEYDIGRTPLVECHIDTGESRPIRQPLRRQPLKHMDVIDEHVNEMLRHGVIEPAASPWASNVVIVSKKDGSLRFCVDYRAVNAVTYKDSYPLPLIDNCINAMTGSAWFTTLDLRAGYHNIPVAVKDRDKTAFITRRGCWRYTVMPFGLTCSPSVFQRLMDMVLGSWIWCYTAWPTKSAWST